MACAIGIGIGLAFPTGTGESTPPPEGALEIDGLQILIDGVPIIFS